ncbi:guanylate kinase [Ancrocorticia populi]|uniref:Guanylate kinase n=1 Tax=Ancrocorticia populi TaxID=2175228 RepID=A0A2V1KAI8_9ACTO|nr:guanylate kinase [Ancrocorticia populi]MDN6487621.1 guanylate kinase [Ancrocorticia sp.]PWF26395.1 guanylate kinase [Ancrocorticia populi]
MVQSHRVFLLAGPSGVGKGTVLAELRARDPECWISVSATTRPPRPGEIDGVHYHFVTDAQFDELVAGGQMLEWAIVHGKHRYGTPREPVEQAVRDGHIAILELDLDGARQIRKSMPEVFQVFLKPPSWEELVHRLRGRGTESEEQIARRIQTARVEMAAESEFDATVVNNSVSGATDELLHIMGIDQ